MKILVYLFVIMVLVSGCASTEYFTRNGQEINPVGQTYYTKVNIWYNFFGQVEPANIHTGIILSAGTEVKIASYGGRSIKFRINLGKQYTLINSRKYDYIGLTEFFDRYFVDKKTTEDFNNFTEIEKKNIRSGNIAQGMSKEAVLMSWGYPPSKKTPDLLTNIWTYWGRSSVDQVLVYFENNRVDTISPYNKDTELNFNMKAWLGQSSNDLIASWGTPQQILDDGQGGKIFVYIENRQRTTPGYSFTDTISDFYGAFFRNLSNTYGISNSFSLYRPPQVTQWTVTRTFWIDKNGNIYRSAWKGH